MYHDLAFVCFKIQFAMKSQNFKPQVTKLFLEIIKNESKPFETFSFDKIDETKK